MKKTKALSVLALALVLLVSFTGCQMFSKSDEEKIIGKWKGGVNLSSQLMDSIKENSGDISKYIDIDDFTIDIVMEFSSDNQAKVYVDEKSVTKALEKIKPLFSKAIKKYTKKLLKDEGITQSLEKVLESQGYDSFEKYFEKNFDIDSIADKFTSNGKVSVGKYRIEDNKILTSDDMDEYIEFAFDDNDNLKITDIKGENAEIFSQGVLPITMKKVK